MSTILARQLPPWYLTLPAIVVGTGVLLPLAYLFVRAFQAEATDLAQIVFRARNLYLFVNTFLLAAGVLAVGGLLATLLAWLTTRTELKGKRIFVLLGVLPLAIPGYVMAYTLLGLSGPDGIVASLFGLRFPPLSGYWGALIALSFCTFPYLFMNVRSALLGLDAALEESAESLGYKTWEVSRYVVIPQLRPTLYAGGLIVGMHVLGDFGVVSLMRYETFSFALYSQTQSFDFTYAAWLALVLLALAGVFIYIEAKLLRGTKLHRTGSGPPRKVPLIQLGPWHAPAYIFLGVLAFTSVVVPTSTICFWMLKENVPANFQSLYEALWGSIFASTPAALLSTCFAVPLAYLGVRYPTSLSRILERVAYIGYATPPVAFALALMFFTLLIPGIYQTLWVLVFAYTLHFLAEAIGPVRGALYQAPPRLEEAAQSLGYSPLKAFFKTTFPLLRSGLTASTALVFLSAMKELPLTELLSPAGYETLAVNVWSYTNEVEFAKAAPYALAILLFSALFVGLLLNQERIPRATPA